MELQLSDSISFMSYNFNKGLVMWLYELGQEDLHIFISMAVIIWLLVMYVMYLKVHLNYKNDEIDTKDEKIFDLNQKIDALEYDLESFYNPKTVNAIVSTEKKLIISMQQQITFLQEQLAQQTKASLKK